MDGCRFGVVRKAWDLPFLAEPEELAGLRRVIRLHLGLWGLVPVIRDAQLCVSELAANVIKHVGPGTPACLTVSMNGSRLRIEVSDPDTRVLPVLCSAGDGAVRGRGLTLIDAVAERWGVLLRDDSKITWCELATGLRSSIDHADGPRVAKAEALLGLMGMAVRPDGLSYGRLGVAAAEESAIDLIADLLHWLRAHGCDPDSALDRAQTHFEAELGEAV
ncbi:ATP-binding protein [Streptomyces sp. NBC_01433]|uniref:ATP-binding protein n=1 Tax=Streptomyces sp. NBC_01433 TaxID=2903864 RepID=UPI00225299B4|nr:ATP-binding protein [Streptomyces sp. NBC_01433]MCX4676969.1 ATP-binding protein [Streptomyces sp. NBC_01433]